MTDFKSQIKKILVLFSLLMCSSMALAQNFEFTAMGISGAPAQLDTVISTGDTLYVRAFFNKPTGWTAQGTALNFASHNHILVHYYFNQNPIGFPNLSVELPIDSANVFINNNSTPATIDFRLSLSGRVTPSNRAFQIEMGIFGIDENSNVRYSVTRSSYIEVNTTQPVSASPDLNHRTYLRLAGDGETLPPVIESPLNNSLANRIFYVVFSQPEIAERGSLYIRFSNVDTLLFEPVKTLYIHNVDPSSQKIVPINGDSLFYVLGIDSVRGGGFLNQNTSYNVKVAYRDTLGNSEAFDIAGPIYYDSRTESAQLIEPRINSFTDAPFIRVIYDLVEFPDTVKLIFTLDSISAAQDFNSPHILTLAPSLYSTSLVSFLLDGTNIGTNNPLVIANNNGILDRLVNQAVYTVTLSYGDTLTNPNFEISNRYYVWPRDLVTIPPNLSLPLNNTRVGEIFRTQFALPEAPFVGSVKFTIEALTQGTDPGSPHQVILGNLANSGATGLFLNARNFSQSELVTDVLGPGEEEDRNRLVHNLTYRMSISYKDYLGNNAAISNVVTFVYDNQTDLIIITAPAEGDTFALGGTAVAYTLPEWATPGTLKLTLTQTGGPEIDLESPHILYMSDVSPGNKNLQINAVSLASTVGIDSAFNGGSLVIRGIYAMTVSYQDTLLNPAVSDNVQNLSFPSGTTVYFRGETIGNGSVLPGQNDNEAFKLVFNTVSGNSAIRSLKFRVGGTLQSTDLQNIGAILWESTDSLFLPAFDVPRGIAPPWQGVDRELVFDSLASQFSEEESFFFITLSFRPNADRSHFYYLQLLDPTSVDCGGDPILGGPWPIGSPDAALFVDVVSFQALQDTSYGSLIIEWTVASEYENAGFNLYRMADNEAEFYPLASYSNSPELVGRGTDGTSWVYRYRDRQLTTGRTYSYQLEAVSYNLDTRRFDLTASGVPRFIPSDFVLEDAYPNPFNSEVSIRYSVPKTSQVKIIVYNLLGREVRSLVNQIQAPSDYVIKWDGKNDQGNAVPSGLYFYRLETDQGFFKAKKMILLR